MTGPKGALRVLEVSSGIAGAYCGWLLTQLGAAVTRLNLGDEAQRGSASDPISLGLARYNSGKQALDLNSGGGAAHATLDKIFRDTDIVITDDEGQFAGIAGQSLDDLSGRFPDIVFGVASIFGRTGPLATTPAVALDAQALSGVAWVLGEAAREPLSIPPGVLESQAGAHLAAACLMAAFVDGNATTGRIVDIALADVLASYVGVNCRFYIHHGLPFTRAGRRASGSGGAYPFVILPCRDGSVCLSGRTRQEWDRFVEAMGSPDWAKQPRYQNLRAMGRQYPDEVDALVAPWLKLRTKAEIEQLASKHQLTISPLRTFDEVLATPQFGARNFLKPATIKGKAVQAPGLPFKIVEARTPKGSDDLAATMLANVSDLAVSKREGGSKPLAGLRVLDFGWVWSAPQVSGILAQFGAEVIKVEHSRRLDNTRLSGSVFKDGQKVEGPSTEMSPMFHQINIGKLGVTLNAKEPEAVELVKRLVGMSDIVVENMSPGAMERTGLGYEALRGVNDRIIMLAMSGAGQFGPSSDMRTYAPVMSSFAGLENLVGYPGDAPVGALNFGLGDPNAAAHALVALFAALIRRENTGSGCYIDISQTEALLATLTPYLLLSQVEGRQPEPTGNSHPRMAPHGIYPAAGADRWLTLAVASDAQWLSFASVVGEPWVSDARFAKVDGRLAHRQELDQAVARWSATQERDELCAKLRQAGIASSPVQSIAEVWTDPHYAARQMIKPVELPVLGEENLFRAPWLLSDAAPEVTSRGPLLGEHNRQVFIDMLGMTDSEFERLQASGVIS